ncbi:MAG: N-acetylmuramoyl-L-alanine amidase-like domain-containing protein [Myxococcaceae bacterium]
MLRALFIVAIGFGSSAGATTPGSEEAPPPSTANAPAPPQAPASHWAKVSAAERGKEIVARAGLPLTERLIAASEGFLGTPYVISPLGEGPGTLPDPDPLSRFDAVDCLTFVEEALALALSKRPDEFEGLLTRIRYRGAVSYVERNHLMEASWIPSNVKKGFIEDVTDQYGGADTVLTQKTLTERSWSSVSSQALALPPDHQPKGTFPLRMIPLEKVPHHAARVPSGTLLVVIRSDLPLKATRITHVGFVVQKGKRTFLRHAARTFARTVDEDLASFLARNSKYGKWKVDGVSLFAVKQR